ncbi:MAG: aldo/keto reductase [Anaerolineae bacterium]
MQYRPYGNTGMRASTLGFGAMRLPSLPDGTCNYDLSVPMLRRGLDLGINYIDSAWGYINGTSEVAVGKAIKGYDRSKLIIATKIPANDIDGDTWRQRLEIQLQRFDQPYIDVMHFHGLTLDGFKSHLLGAKGCLKAARKAQEEGLVRFLAFSSHDTLANIMELIKTDEFNGVTLQYNILDRHLVEAIGLAHEKGMGTVIMGPVGGGRMAMFSPAQMQEMLPESVASASDLAIRWVLSNPAVTVALSGMNTMEMIEQNVASAEREEPFTSAETHAVTAMLKKLQSFADLYCTGCGYCMPCPNGVDIPGNFLLMNYARVYGMKDYAREQYARLLKGEEVWLQGVRIKGLTANQCVECGACEPKCPQNIPIIDQLKETHEALSA